MALQTSGRHYDSAMERVLQMNIVGSEYYKELNSIKNHLEVIDEIYNQVEHVEPWMSGNARGSSTAFCLLYKLFTLELNIKQVQDLITHEDSPYIRAVGFLYLRYIADPKTLWDWCEPYLEDDEKFAPGTNGKMVTMGLYVRDLLLELYYFDTIFPRIPVPVARQITANLESRGLPTKGLGAGGAGGKTARGAEGESRRPPSVKAALSVAFGQRAPHRSGAREAATADRVRGSSARLDEWDDVPAKPRDRSRDTRDKERSPLMPVARERSRDRKDERERSIDRRADREKSARRERSPERRKERESSRDRRSDRERESRRDRERSRDRRVEPERVRDRSRDRRDDRDRERRRERSPERKSRREDDRGRDRSRERGVDRTKEAKRDRSRDRDRDTRKEGGRDRSRERKDERGRDRRDRSRERGDREKERHRGRSKEQRKDRDEGGRKEELDREKDSHRNGRGEDREDRDRDGKRRDREQETERDGDRKRPRTEDKGQKEDGQPSGGEGKDKLTDRERPLRDAPERIDLEGTQQPGADEEGEEGEIEVHNDRDSKNVRSAPDAPKELEVGT